MQPYLFPYVGYLNLLSSVDTIVLRDRVKYSKGGWVNRNRLEIHDETNWLTLPLQKSSDFDLIGQKCISKDLQLESLRQKLHHGVLGFKYAKVAVGHFDSVFSEVKGLTALFPLLRTSISSISEILSLGTVVIAESELQAENFSAGEEGVIEICKVLGASDYFNAPGGKNLYSPSSFRASGIGLWFVNPQLTVYERPGRNWHGGLSFLDGLAAVGVDSLSELSRSDFFVSKEG